MDMHYKSFRIRDWTPRDRQSVSQLIGRVLAEYQLGWEPEGADQDVVNVEQFYHRVGG